MSLQTYTQVQQILEPSRYNFLEDSERVMELDFLGENKVFRDHSSRDSWNWRGCLWFLFTAGSLLIVGVSMCRAVGKHLAHFLWSCHLAKYFASCSVHFYPALFSLIINPQCIWTNSGNLECCRIILLWMKMLTFP